MACWLPGERPVSDTRAARRGRDGSQPQAAASARSGDGNAAARFHIERLGEACPHALRSRRRIGRIRDRRAPHVAGFVEPGGPSGVDVDESTSFGTRDDGAHRSPDRGRDRNLPCMLDSGSVATSALTVRKRAPGGTSRAKPTPASRAAPPAGSPPPVVGIGSRGHRSFAYPKYARDGGPGGADHLRAMGDQSSSRGPSMSRCVRSSSIWFKRSHISVYSRSSSGTPSSASSSSSSEGAV